MVAAPRTQTRQAAGAPRRLARALACAALLAAGAGCGSDELPSGPAQSFAATPDQTVTSDTGALTVEVRFAPDPPVVGSNAVQLSFKDSGGAPAQNLALTVVPWMPAHGHGTTVEATVTETAPGIFVATPVYLFMPGSWELRMTTSGSVDDTAKAAFELP